MTTKNVLATWNPRTADEMLAALSAAMGLAGVEGHNGRTIHLNKQRLTLVRETLSDGSEVMNLNFFDGEAA